MITVKETLTKQPEYDFAPQTLYKSEDYNRNGNVYLIIGPGKDTQFVAAVRLAGSAFTYCDSILKRCIVPFDGEVVIKNV